MWHFSYLLSLMYIGFTHSMIKMSNFNINETYGRKERKQEPI